MTNEEFLLPVIKRRTGQNGKDNSFDILRRMDNPVCKQCHEDYKKKYPGKSFHVICQGIYTDVDVQKLAKGSGLSVEDTRDVLDPLYWASKHIHVTDENGDIQLFQPRDYQEGVLSCTANRKVDRMGRGMGKMLALDTPIPTPSGWKTMGTIQVGDKVFDADGIPTKVIYISPIQFSEHSYNVIFSDGSVIKADSNHLWETWTHAARKAAYRYPIRIKPRVGPLVLTTEEIKATLLHGNGKRVERNHSIPVAGVLQYTKKKLIVPPYTLGAWLGDGNSNSGGFTGIDIDIIHGIENDGFVVKQSRCDPQKWHIHRLIGFLRKLRILNNKYIPEQYLHSNFADRMALLQGLMDTDGHVDKNGNCSFDNMNAELAKQVYELIVGLGIKATFGTKQAMLNGVSYGICYHVRFLTILPIFRLSRKLERLHITQRKTQDHRYIVDVKPVKSVLMRCISVDNPRHLYLAGLSCIPTHNTLLGVIEELHRITTRKNYKTLVLCPAKAQAKKWFDDILQQCEWDPELGDSIAGRVQQPFYQIDFKNGSQIAIFTAGSSSGRDADVIRSQTPMRVRLEEQDLLNEGDYKAVTPLLRRYKKSEFHGSSTPTGARSQFWKMCMQFSDYREFYAPITLHPDWSLEMEEACRREARTDDMYRHEFLAEFGDLAQGVFKAYYVDQSRKNYRYKTCRFIPGMKYYLGVDWNGQGTGTRIRVIEYNPESKKRRIVEAATVDGPQVTTQDSLDRIRDLNRYWHCEDIYIDRGFGNVQDEMLRLIGKKAKDPDDKRLMEIKVIDFGAEIKTNKLVPNRGNSKYLDKEEEKRRTKPFMVEGAVMCLENGLFEFSDIDDILDAQFRAYKVKTWSQHGFANTYEAGREGDHDLDATMLALLGIELKYGITAVPISQRLAQITYAAALGSGPSNPVDDAKKAAEIRQRAQETSQVPSRQVPDRADDTSPKIVLPGQTSHIIIPGRAKGTQISRVPSRTSTFRQSTSINRSIPTRTQPMGPIRRPPNQGGNPFDSPFIPPRRGARSDGQPS